MSNINLRPHQNQVLDELRKGWRDHNIHLVYANVGFGKTILAAKIIEGYAKAGKRALFIAPYVTLVQQTFDKFIEYGLPEPSIIWRNHPKYDPSNLIQIASADTLTRRDFPDVDIVIIDEVHIRRTKILNYVKEKDIRTIGLSGTPFAPFLSDYFTHLVKVRTMKQMIQEGFLSDYVLYAPTIPDLSGVKVKKSAEVGFDYDEDQAAAVMGEYKLVADVVQTWLRLGEDRPTICFACNVAHANQITNEFNDAGVTTEVMTADTPTEERRTIINRFELGTTKIIVNVGVLVAGFDSDVRCVIYAKPTKSEMRYIQCIGRGLRTAKGKENCIVLDHSGTAIRLGLPCSIEYDELPTGKDKGSESSPRKKVEEQIEKLESLPKPCSKCGYMKDAKEFQCSRCGHKPLRGEDVETDVTRELEQLRGMLKEQDNAESVIKSERQDYYSMLLFTANKKGYSQGWAAHQFKSRYGEFPNGLNQEMKHPDVKYTNYQKHLAIKRAKGRARNSK